MSMSEKALQTRASAAIETDSSERQSLKLYAVITHWVVCQIPVKTLNYVGDWSLSFGRTMPLCKITRPSEQRKNLTALVFRQNRPVFQWLHITS